MERNIKLIWDFRGKDAEMMAKHHTIHLQEYSENKNLQIQITGSEKINEMHYVAFLVVTQAEMKPVRDALKPHRGEYYNE